jgi:hypothetical protein
MGGPCGRRPDNPAPPLVPASLGTVAGMLRRNFAVALRTEHPSVAFLSGWGVFAVVPVVPRI